MHRLSPALRQKNLLCDTSVPVFARIYPPTTHPPTPPYASRPAPPHRTPPDGPQNELGDVDVRGQLLRNIPPDEWVTEVAKAYPGDDEIKGMMGQVGKLMRMISYYQAKNLKK